MNAKEVRNFLDKIEPILISKISERNSHVLLEKRYEHAMLVFVEKLSRNETYLFSRIYFYFDEEGNKDMLFEWLDRLNIQFELDKKFIYLISGYGTKEHNISINSNLNKLFDKVALFLKDFTNDEFFIQTSINFSLCQNESLINLINDISNYNNLPKQLFKRNSFIFNDDDILEAMNKNKLIVELEFISEFNITPIF